MGPTTIIIGYLVIDNHGMLEILENAIYFYLLLIKLISGPKSAVIDREALEKPPET